MKRVTEALSSIDVRIVALAVFYYVSAQLGLWLSFPVSSLSPLWPPPGIALALILLLGHRTWPAITIGSLIAYTLVFLQQGVEFNMDAIAALVMIAIGNTVEALFGFLLINQLIRRKNPFLKTSHVFIYLLVTLTTCLLGAFIGASALVFNHIVPYNSYLSVFSFWWVCNVASVLTITPFIISWTSEFSFKFSRKRVLEVMIFVFTLGGVLLSLNIEPAAPTIEKSLPFLIIPFLLWLAFRFNLQTASTGIMVVSFCAIYFTIQGNGPFVLDSESSSLLILQIFIGLVSISTIILYATVHERTLAQKALQEFNATLEAKVKERTKELHEEIQTRKQAEEKIIVSNKELRKANIELDNFVYSVSHDLRAPIASVLGIVNLARKENDIEIIRRYLNMVAQSAEKQDLFIKDILDLSRNSRLEVTAENIDFNEMINETFDQLKYGTQEKKVAKNINVSQNVLFRSDLKRLKVVFNNLISNALRYSCGKKPAVWIDVVVDDITAKIIIKDNGIGIAAEHLENVFQMFYRATDDNAGSGLGLYIVKETVERLRGSIELTSKEEEGTVVTMEVPNLATHEAESTPKSETKGKELKAKAK